MFRLATSVAKSVLCLINPARIMLLNSHQRKCSNMSAPLTITVLQHLSLIFLRLIRLVVHRIMFNLRTTQRPERRSYDYRTDMFLVMEAYRMLQPFHIFNLPELCVNLQVTNDKGCQGLQVLKTITGYITVTEVSYQNFSDSLSSSCNHDNCVF